MRTRIEVDPALDPVVLPTSVLNEIFAHAREAEPEECCGLITGGDDARYHFRPGAPRKPHHDFVHEGDALGGPDCPEVWRA